MQPDIETRLENAVISYAKGLDLEGLINYVVDDLWQYYTDSADEEEAIAFIEEMESDDAS